MEETLGKRIVANRKRLGITQDRLAEQLGVTAQAVSKWENDQSCPDITIVPKLAEIFGITTDALLGLASPEPEQIPESGLIAEETGSDTNHSWELRWDGGRKSYLALAAWIILTAGWMFVARFSQIDVGLWDLLWTNGLIVFGISGLLRRFSFFRFGCGLVGLYYLLDKCNAIPVYLGEELLLPVFLLLFGLCLLANAFRKPEKSHVSVIRNGKSIGKERTGSQFGDDFFQCACSFGSRHQVVELPRLRCGNAEVSFGELTVDLSGCGEFAQDCTIHADCSFGQLTLLVPGRCRAEIDADSAFGSVDIRGSHSPEAAASVHIHADANFGQIIIQYT